VNPGVQAFAAGVEDRGQPLRSSSTAMPAQFLVELAVIVLGLRRLRAEEIVAYGLELLIRAALPFGWQDE
jgi:hypothetical protein